MNSPSGIEALAVEATVMGNRTVIYPTLIWDPDATILVDTGYPGQLPLIHAAMENIGVPFHQLNKVVITHQDLDHIGNLPAIRTEATQPIEVMASAVERPFIQGDKRLLKITPEAIAKAVASLPADVSAEQRMAFQAALENPPRAKVNRTLFDEEELPYCDGIVIIPTPGHTPGHISLYHKRSKTLIAGDAMVVNEGQLWGPTPVIEQRGTGEGKPASLLNRRVPTPGNELAHHG